MYYFSARKQNTTQTMKTTTATAQAERLKISASFKAFLERHYSDCKVSRLLWVAANSPLHASRLVTTDALNYITNRSDGLLSYLPKGKQCQYTEDGLWSRSNRQEGRPARVIRSLFSNKVMKLLKESDLERFASYYSAFTVLHSYAKITQVTGAEIADVYKHPHPTFSSCMNCADRGFFSIYTCNSDVISMLVMTDERDDEDPKLIGRALVWKLPDGRTFCDRIYGQNMDCIEYLKQYAMEQGWYVKPRQTYDDKTTFQDPNGTVFEETYRIALKTDFGAYPYLDTFTYGGDGWLTNDVTCDYQHQYTNTNGTRNEEVEDIHGEMRERSECVWSNYHNGYIYENNAYQIAGDWFECDECEDETMICIDGEEYSASDCTYYQVRRAPNGQTLRIGRERCLSAAV